MKFIVKLVYILFSLVFLVYLALPTSNFPIPPSKSLQSDEPADTETLSRRAYFTEWDRDGVVGHYLVAFNQNVSFLPVYRLNYPPEDANFIIRDQTRSVYLEEIVHPLRESLFVNGFQASQEKDQIIINDKLWLAKITVRHVESSFYSRLLVGIFILLTLPFLVKNWSDTLSDMRTSLTRLT